MEYFLNWHIRQELLRYYSQLWKSFRRYCDIDPPSTSRELFQELVTHAAIVYKDCDYLQYGTIVYVAEVDDRFLEIQPAPGDIVSELADGEVMIRFTEGGSTEGRRIEPYGIKAKITAERPGKT